MDEDFGKSRLLDINEMAGSRPERWFNLEMTRVNECIVRMGVFEGEYHWHKHDEEDEFFFCVSGKMLLDLEGGTIELLPGQGYTVPKRIKHRTRAEERTIVMMVEKAGVVPAGD